MASRRTLSQLAENPSSGPIGAAKFLASGRPLLFVSPETPLHTLNLNPTINLPIQAARFSFWFIF